MFLKHPHNVQVSREGATVYAVSHSDNIVVAIDPATYRVAAVAATGPAPAHVIEAPNGKVYVTNTADGTVSVYQAPGLQPVGRIQLGDMPHGLRAAAGGSVIVVANTMAGALDLIDPPPTSQWARSLWVPGRPRSRSPPTGTTPMPASPIRPRWSKWIWPPAWSLAPQGCWPPRSSCT